ncbi:MAG: hypothetical protein U0002_11675 [Thermoanaerobaculia bacterium]
MGDEQDDTWKRFVERYVTTLELGRRRPVEEHGLRFRVRELDGRRFAVVRVGDSDRVVPDAVFNERSTAYMAAAVLTAFGSEEIETRPLAAVLESLAAEPQEVREPVAAMGTGAIAPELTYRLLQAFVRNPAAIELLLEGMDDDTVEKARTYLLTHLKPSSDLVN